MNFEKVRKKNRKAISPVLATVILIAITLIAAIAIAGFVFGLFGSFTSSAQVSAQVTSCIAGPAASSANNNVCTVVLTNTGTSNVAVTGGSVQIAGTAHTCNGALALNTIAASSSAQFVCLQLAATPGQTVGSQAIGTVTLSNGASVPFSGTWS
jgi:flagellin-like protein